MKIKNAYVKLNTRPRRGRAIKIFNLYRFNFKICRKLIISALRKTKKKRKRDKELLPTKQRDKILHRSVFASNPTREFANRENLIRFAEIYTRHAISCVQ